MRKGLLNKVFIYLLLLFVGTNAFAQTCLPNGITFTSQAQIDNFATDYPDCTGIIGGVKIQESVAGDITNLAGLHQIETIEKGLTIIVAANLQDFSGLENLTTIGEHLWLVDNEALVDCSGLTSLTTIGGKLIIIGNSSFQSFTGLSALTTVGEDVDIQNNDLLEGFAALQSLTTINGDFKISNNYLITNFLGLENLNELGGSLDIQNNEHLTTLLGLELPPVINGNLRIFRNSSLSSLSALSNITHVGLEFAITGCDPLENLNDFSNIISIGGNLSVADNDLMTSLFATSTLTSIGGAVWLYQNDILQDISGLENLITVKSIRIDRNDALLNLAGLEAVTTLTGTLFVYKNENLQSLSGLENLTSIGGNVTIEGSDNLLNLSGIDNLVTIGGSTFIMNNGITSLVGLTSLSTLDGGLTIYFNHDLESFSGLESLTSIGGNFEIQNNIILTDLSALQNLTTIGGRLLIYDNDELSSLLGMNALTTIGNSLNIYTNYSLESISELSGLTTLGGIQLLNARLTSLHGLEGITTIPGEVFLGNTALTNLEGLNNLTAIGGYLSLLHNTDLLSLNGIESLATIGDTLGITDNANLSDIWGLANVDFTNTSAISIKDNQALSFCGQENICHYIVIDGNITVDNNEMGCSSMQELLLNCFENVPHTSFIGSVIADVDLNCEENNNEIAIPSWLVHVFNDDYAYSVTTDSLGNYWLPVFEGDFTLAAISPSAFWTPCMEDTTLYASAAGDSIIIDFFMQPQGDCPYLDWSLTVPPLRVCQSRTITLNYCNYGALPAEDAIFSIDLDPNLTIDSASIPYIIDAEGLLLFEIAPVGLFECDEFTLSVFLDCDSVDINDIICVDVHLMSDELCAPDALWDGSIINATGFCENDSIYFQLENIGTGDMFQVEQFRIEIVIDDIILMLTTDNYQLTAGEILMLSYEVEGQGMRLEADQTVGNPVETEASIVIPNCENEMNNIILTLLPNNNGDPFSEIYCVPAVNSLDPNIKSAIPAGIGENHEIKKDWNLNYTIEFQNTGNDVAYVVVIKDTLSENLDLTTLRVKGASHPFTWSLNFYRELVFTFDDILLPDSTSNEPESHGYVQFSITPKATILPYETIENSAAIYFDFNDPIITNTVLHTILKPVVSSSERLFLCEYDVYQEQIITQDTTIALTTSFVEYDSIHFVHIEVLPQITNTLTVDVPIGEYIEGVLIENDTSFVLNYTAENGCDSLVIYVVSVITGVDNSKPFKAVEIYPNPVSTTLHISNHQNGEAQEWTLVNNLGVNVWKTNLSANESLKDVRVRNLPAGIYCLQVKTNQRRKAWKVVVQ